MCGKFCKFISRYWNTSLNAFGGSDYYYYVVVVVIRIVELELDPFLSKRVEVVKNKPTQTPFTFFLEVKLHQ